MSNITRVRRLRARADAIEAELERLESLPLTDDYPDETVLLFKRKYPSNEKAYTYVLLKINGGWYSTGTSNNLVNANWAKVIDKLFINGGWGVVTEVWTVSEWAAAEEFDEAISLVNEGNFDE